MLVLQVEFLLLSRNGLHILDFRIRKQHTFLKMLTLTKKTAKTSDVSNILRID